MKAYTVTCDGGDGDAAVVRFADHGIVARREGANELDSEFEYVSCTRSPHLDQYSPGPVPPLVLIDHGWWFECSGCGIRVNEECEHEDDDGNFIKLKPVAYGYHGVCCTQACLDKYEIKRAETKRREIAAIADLTEDVCRRYRGCLLEGEPHAYVCQRSDKDYSWWTVEQAYVTFSFPGAKIRATAQLRREKGDLSLTVCAGDVPAWNDWRASVKCNLIGQAEAA